MGILHIPDSCEDRMMESNQYICPFCRRAVTLRDRERGKCIYCGTKLPPPSATPGGSESPHEVGRPSAAFSLPPRITSQTASENSERESKKPHEVWPTYPGPTPPRGPYHQPGYQGYQPPYPGAGYYQYGQPLLQKNTVGVWGLVLTIIACALCAVPISIGVVVAMQIEAAGGSEADIDRELESMGILLAGFLCPGFLCGVAGLICSVIGLSRRYMRRTVATIGTIIASILLFGLVLLTLIGMAAGA